jgi:hypothetical protein
MNVWLILKSICAYAIVNNGRRTIVRLIAPLAAVALVFVSCGSGPAPASNEAGSGQVLVEKKAVVKFADGTVDEFTVNEYDPSDITLLRQKRFSASGSPDSLTDQVEFTYDEEKRVLTNKLTRDDVNPLKSRIDYEYDKATNRLLTETIFDKSNRMVSANKYTYNSDGNVASRVILNGSGQELARTVYTYKGNLAVASETRDGKGRKISSSVNEYDRKGKLVGQTLKNAADVVTRKISTVWQNDLELETTQTAADGKLQLRITNEYGASGELLRKTVENYLVNSKQVMEFEYETRPERGNT